MIVYDYHNEITGSVVFHYIFSTKVYEALINQNYAYIHFSSSSIFTFVPHVERLKKYRVQAEKILHKVALLNLQYSLLNLHFCLCIIESYDTIECEMKFSLYRALYKAENAALSVLDLSNLEIDLISCKCFESCTNLESIILANNITEIGGSCFRECLNLRSIILPNSITMLGDYCFIGCTNLKSITLPNNVTELGDYCFCDCQKLERLTIPNIVTKIGFSCFETCINLKSILIPNSVTKIGDYCFLNCTNLESITILNNEIELGDYCFQWCRNLRELIIPKGLKIEPEQIGLPVETKITRLNTKKCRVATS